MKKRIITILFLLIILVICVTFILSSNKDSKTFYLEDSYYGESKMIELNIDELNDLIDKKESFAVFLYQPSCIASADFESVLNEFINSNKISIYKLTFSSIKNTEIGEKIKYYPSFMIYNKGEMVDFLESDKDEDVEYYTSKDGFTKWFTKYVKLREVDSNSISTNDNSNNDDNSNNSSDENSSIKKVRLDNVKKAKNKVNIYFFWGDGCPHCEKELEFFNSIKDKYGKYYNLHAYETWYNSSNAEIRNIFATAMGNKEKGVPYTVIGEKSFVGFGDEMKEDFIKAIVEESKKDFDVYFDKLKE